MNDSYLKIIASLRSALADDFRGFLCEGTERIEVPDELYHLQVAYQEMKKVPGWKYVSGTGQNPTIEYMDQKRAIYITKIPMQDDQNQFQRTVGYLTDSYSEIVEYNGAQMPIYEVFKKIALNMGYDVDEYTLLKDKSNSTVKTPTSIKIYKSTNKIRGTTTFSPNRNLKNGDKPVFSSDNALLGFISNGKFVSKDSYNRYSSPGIKKSSEPDSELDL